MGVGVSSESSPARAVTAVIPGVTVGVLGAVAGINTFLVPAGQGVGTVVIHLALRPQAFPVGVAIEA